MRETGSGSAQQVAGTLGMRCGHRPGDHATAGREEASLGTLTCVCVSACFVVSAPGHFPVGQSKQVERQLLQSLTSAEAIKVDHWPPSRERSLRLAAAATGTRCSRLAACARRV